MSGAVCIYYILIKTYIILFAAYEARFKFSGQLLLNEEENMHYCIGDSLVVQKIDERHLLLAILVINATKVFVSLSQTLKTIFTILWI